VTESGAPRSRTPLDVMALFGILWAAAALFHALGPSARATRLFDDLTAVGVGHALLVVAALCVLMAPQRTAPLVALAVMGPVTAWQEAPILGTHWFIVAIVDVGLLLALASGWRGRSLDAEVVAQGVLPVARWTLVGFYSFAAFAKLNHGFFDTTVSCGSVFFDETARSLGLSTPIAVGGGGWASLVPVSTAGIELLVPVLLIIRRTRAVGVMLGLFFHSVIALDQEHLFSDFSSALCALFVLFLPDEFASWAIGLLRGGGRLAVQVWAGFVAVVALAQWTGRGDLISSIYEDGRTWLWLSVDVALVGAVVWWLLRDQGAPLAQPFALPRRARWLAVVPVLVVINGALPYVELKTTFAYTMYSNLEVLDGSTNHLIVPATLPIGHRQAGLVRVEETDDPGLAQYALRQYLLPWDSFRSYLSRHPDVRIRYKRDGVDHDLAKASDEPGLTDGPSVLVQKLLPLRSVDSRDPPRCQESFLPAL
jgi:hypothetical protein